MTKKRRRMTNGELRKIILERRTFEEKMKEQKKI